MRDRQRRLEDKKNRFKGEFLGRKITPKNRRKVWAEYRDRFINVESKLPTYKDLSNDELLEYSETFATYEINREIKHYKAYLKNKKSYRYKDKTHPVLVGTKDAVFHSDLMRATVSNEEE